MEENDKHKRAKDLIVNEIENGLTFKDACVLAGISEVTGHRLKALRGEEKERLKELEDKDILNKEEQIELKELAEQRAECESFESRCEAAVITYKKKLIGYVNKGSVTDARHALEMLKVKFPQEYNIAKRVEHSGEIDHNVRRVEDIVDSLLVDDIPAEITEGKNSS